MDGYQALAEAIIAQAAMDYLEAMRVIRDYPDAKGAMKEIRRIERFIHSAWFGVLTKVDPDYLIGQMRVLGGSRPSPL
ncbi:MAG: hypothetical protein IKE24_01435 [Clostridia bacterium]|nr:hypothetical protein [Clostridia bacterium]